MIDGIQVFHGDSRDILKTLADNSVDSCVTDPPYALVSIVKRFGKAGSAPAKGNAAYTRASSGFMGQQWDTGDTAFDPEFWAEVLRVLKPGGHLLAFSGTRTYHRMAVAIEDAGFEIRDQGAWCYGSGFPKSHNQHGEFEGWGTALKPAWEPIAIARKPLEGTVAQNLAKWGVGALNIDGCRIASESLRTKTGSGFASLYEGGKLSGEWTNDLGRWPANLIHDGSDEVVALFPDSDGQQGDVRGTEPSKPTDEIYGQFSGRVAAASRNDSGSAARFFYTAKADAEDRFGSKHPTVKPIDLMRYLIRLVTPKGGIVLDPFAGSGTTGVAAVAEGMRCTMIEREERFVADIQARLDHLSGAGAHSTAVKQRQSTKKPSATPLFGED